MMREGDIVAIKAHGNQFNIVKILRIDAFPDGKDAYHCLSYQTVERLPSLEQITVLSVIAWHSPIAGSTIARDGMLIGNISVCAEELVGFHEYLKFTDWPRYVQETGFDPAMQLPLAQQHYLEGNLFAEEQRFQEAIDSYSKALEVFPIFMEALDNRGLAKMDLGKHREAIDDFKQSLAAHGANPIPLCSMGECYLKLGEYDAAERVFESCVAKWPEEAQFKRFQLMAVLRRLKETAPKKSWWRFW